MTTSSTDRIEKQITLKASPARVWRALTDHVEFSEWFGVSLEGPILMGEEFRGQITHPGCEHMTLRAWVERMDSEQCFAFRWHPHADAPGFDHASEPTTLVEFVLEPRDGGTHLTICESGFDELPEEHRSKCFERNEGGWTLQVQRITAHVDGAGVGDANG